MYQIAGLNLSLASKTLGFIYNRSLFNLFKIDNNVETDIMLELNALESELPKSPKKNDILREVKQLYKLSYEENVERLVANKYSCYVFSKLTNKLNVFLYKTVKPYLKINMPIMFLLANSILQQNKVLVHAASGVINNRAFAILGIPEAGKSTAISLIEHDFLLSDDIIIIGDADKSAVAYSTPLGTNSDGQKQAPLTAIFFPVKSNHFELKKLTKLQGKARFYLSQSGYWNKVMTSYRAKYFDAVNSIVSKSNVYEILFDKNHIDNKQIIQAILAT